MRAFGIELINACGRRKTIAGVISAVACLDSELATAAPGCQGPAHFLGLAEVRGGLHRHRTTAGEKAWSRIAANFGVDYGRLLRVNKIRNPRWQPPGRFVLIDTVRLVPRSPHEGIVVNQAENKVYLFRQGLMTLRFPAAVGAPGWRTPLGHFYIVEKKMHPTWLVPLKIQDEQRRAGRAVMTSMPPGPNNPLGSYWLGLGKGFGIHGTTAPWSIGHYTTHGCVRLRTEQSRILFNAVTEQDTVRVIYQPVQMAVRNGEVYLQVVPPVPGFAEANLSLVRGMAAETGLTSRIDWQAVQQALLRGRTGIAGHWS